MVELSLSNLCLWLLLSAYMVNIATEFLQVSEFNSERQLTKLVVYLKCSMDAENYK